MKVYGIKNCDTVKKALTWLEKNRIPYEFHDYKKLGISPQKLEEWSAQLGWDRLLNKRGTTWKKLDPDTQNSIRTKEDAFMLMQEKTSIIKRPLIEDANNLLLGFDEAEYTNLLIKQ